MLPQNTCGQPIGAAKKGCIFCSSCTKCMEMHTNYMRMRTSCTGMHIECMGIHKEHGKTHQVHGKKDGNC